jgi:hypothetical protein
MAIGTPLAPQNTLSRVWTPHGLQNDTRCALTRAVVGDCDCCLLEETTFGFPIRRVPTTQGCDHGTGGSRPAALTARSDSLPESVGEEKRSLGLPDVQVASNLTR